MEQRSGGPAFLIRFSATADLEGEAGVATHVQTGERFEFDRLSDLERFLRERLTLDCANRHPTPEKERDG
jgi:hypothetical protein